ncbi:hypothetical protein M5689_004623 [Euphorbia peplus]|nr:hypothetical protein M5689_004623 [Euphorbia peplus]
MYSSSGKFCCL